MIHRPAWSSDVRVIELGDEGAAARSIRRLRRRLDDDRPTGLHCSTIVNDYVETAYPTKRRNTFGVSTIVAFQEVGNLVEDVIAEAFRERSGWEKPTPRRCDGIWCSPDGYDRRTRTIDEMKATWVSERDFLDSPKMFKYVLQSVLYAHVWKAVRVRIHVFFINGNYRPPAPRMPRTFTLKWTGDVPAQWWARAVQHAEDRGWRPSFD